MTEAEIIEEEYKEFSYIVAHDLNAPLRHIREFSKLLINSHSHQPSDEEKTYIGFLNQSLEKIDNMQKVLLTFSRINTTFRPEPNIELNKIIKLVLNDFETDILEKKAIINISGNAQITGNDNLLHLLFSHLIDNCLCFKSPNRHMVINIVIQEKENSTVISIKDTGIGFDNSVKDKAFRLFHRSDISDNKKLGAGLAFAKKIVTLHGGRIEAFSDVNKGSDFIITIPKSSV